MINLVSVYVKAYYSFWKHPILCESTLFFVQAPYPSCESTLFSLWKHQDKSSLCVCENALCFCESTPFFMKALYFVYLEKHSLLCESALACVCVKALCSFVFTHTNWVYPDVFTKRIECVVCVFLWKQHDKFCVCVCVTTLDSLWKHYILFVKALQRVCVWKHSVLCESLGWRIRSWGIWSSAQDSICTERYGKILCESTLFFMKAL